MPKRELSKCREWERERRDRLKTCFASLCRLLPCYDPSIVLSKLEILQRAATFIEELQRKNKDLLLGDSLAAKVEKEELNRLQERIKKLTLRNEQLANLLSDAGIKLPTECGNVKKFSEPRQWSNRVTPEKAELLYRKFRNGKEIQNTATKKKFDTSGVQQQANKKIQVKKSLIAATVKKKKALKKKCKADAVLSNDQASKTAKGVIGVGGAATAATVTSHSQTTTLVTRNCSLGPGTLILANGNIVPVLPSGPQIQTTILTAPTQIMVRRAPLSQQQPKPPSLAPPTTALILMQQQQQHCGRPLLPMVRPKPGVTRTTTVNKVPIPALTSSRLCRPAAKISVVATVTKKKQLLHTIPRVRSAKIKVASEPPAKPKVVDGAIEPKATGGEREKTEEAPAPQTSQVGSSNQTTEKKTVDERVGKAVVSSANYSIDSICNSADKTSVVQHNLQLRDEHVAEVEGEQEQTGTKETTVPRISPAVSPHAVSMQEEKRRGEEGTVAAAHPDLVERPMSPDKDVHSDLSNDIFASLQVPSAGGHNPESISPTAAFLLAFPLVSSLTGGKVSEVMVEENSDSRPEDSPTLLQIGGTVEGSSGVVGSSMVNNKSPSQHQQQLTPNLLSLDNFSNLFSGTSTRESVPTDCLLHQSRRNVTSREQPLGPHQASRPPVNWMTGPDVRPQQPPHQHLQQSQQHISSSSSMDFALLPSFGKDFDFGSGGSNANGELRYEGGGGSLVDENHFSWSPTKLPPTLPTLVGDLALGTTTTTSTTGSHANKYFLSVSQLVDRSADVGRQHSRHGGRPPPTSHLSKPSSNYSAEALIGGPSHSSDNTGRQYHHHHHHPQHQQSFHYHTQPPPPQAPLAPFAPDPVMSSYFPAVELGGGGVGANVSTQDSASFLSSDVPPEYVCNNNGTGSGGCSNLVFTRNHHRPDRRLPTGTIAANAHASRRQHLHHNNQHHQNNVPQQQQQLHRSRNINTDLSFLNAPLPPPLPAVEDFHGGNNGSYLSTNQAGQIYGGSGNVSGSHQMGLSHHQPVPVTTARVGRSVTPHLHSIMSAPASTSLTNFNLTTIFPEMNQQQQHHQQHRTTVSSNVRYERGAV